MDGALDRHVVLVGFMGAGKTMVGGHVARQLGRPFVDVDEAIAAGHGPIAELFAEQGEAAFREVEARFVREALARPEPTVIAVGGGAVETPGLLHDDRATVVHLPVDVEAAWQRAQSSDRPLAQDEAEFRRRFELRAPLYVAVADATARDADDVVLAAAGVHVERGALQRLGGLVPGDGKTALVSDPQVAGIHGMDAQLALGSRLTETHELLPGEEAPRADPSVAGRFGNSWMDGLLAASMRPHLLTSASVSWRYSTSRVSRISTLRACEWSGE